MSKYNPFNPNSVVSPSLFAGRTNQVIGICKKLSQLKHKMPASFFIYGERGIGKTALVKLIKYVAENKDPDLYNLNLLTSYYIVEQGQDIGSVLEESINKFTNQMDGAVIESLSKKLGDLFKNGKFSIGAYGFNASADFTKTGDVQKREITIKDQSVSILESILSSLSESKENKKDGILIIIDEMHNLNGIKSSASVLRNIITTLDVDNLGSISFLLIGYKDDMENFFDGDPSAHRSFDSLMLNTMPDIEAIQVLEKGFKEIDFKFDIELLKKNISTAGGYPHSIQLLGNHLVDIDNDNLIDEKDWDSALVKTITELQTKDFSRMYSFGSKPLKAKDEILNILAEKNKPTSQAEIRKELLGKNIYQYIPDLKKSGAIRQNENGDIYLQSQLFRTAILIDNFMRKLNEKTKSPVTEE